MTQETLKVLGLLEKARTFFANGVRLVDLCHTAVLAVALAQTAQPAEAEPSPPPPPPEPAPGANDEPAPVAPGSLH